MTVLRRAGLVAVGFLALTLSVVTAQADKRVALVLGNSAYQHVTKLPNPENDANDVAEALRSLNFDVIFRTNADRRGLDSALEEFERKAAGADTALFFFAGHGLQYRGRNYLLPVDADLEDEVSLRYNTLAIDKVREALDSASGVKIMILDACRNNPLSDQFVTRTAGLSRGVSATRGLARLDRTEGMVVAYATQADQVAQDGSGRNSPFSSALIHRLNEPNLEIATLFRRVAQDVYEQTGGKQRPELSISLLQDFYLNMRDDDSRVWRRLNAKPDVTEAELQDFVTKFPSSAYAREAQTKLYVLRTLRTEREAISRQLADLKAAREDLDRRDKERQIAGRKEDERREKERADLERIATENRARAQAEEARLETERRANEKHEFDKAEAARQSAEKIEREQAEKKRLAAEALERDRLVAQKREADRLEAERVAAATREAAKAEAERVAAVRKAAEQAANEERERKRQETERLVAEKKEADRVAAKAEAERLAIVRKAAEQAATDERERKRLEAERLTAEKKEAERVAAKAEAERLAAVRKAAEQAASDERERKRLETERLVAERKEADRVAAEKKEAERLEAQRVADAAHLEQQRIQVAALEAEGRRKAEAEQARARQAEVCAQETTEIGRLTADKQSAALAALKPSISCPGLVASIDKAIGDLLKAHDKACREDARAFGKIGKDDIATLKVFIIRSTCDNVKQAASERVAALETERSQREAACASDGAKLSAARSETDTGVATESLRTLQTSLSCEALRPDVMAALKLVDPSLTKTTNAPEQIRGAQLELQRIGCFDGDVSGTFDRSTKSALGAYERVKGSSVPKEIGDDLVASLKSETGPVCKPSEPSIAAIPPSGHPEAAEPKKSRKHVAAREQVDEDEAPARRRKLPPPPVRVEAPRHEAPRHEAPKRVERAPARVEHAVAPARARAPVASRAAPPPGPTASSSGRAPQAIGVGF